MVRIPVLRCVLSCDWKGSELGVHTPLKTSCGENGSHIAKKNKKILPKLLIFNKEAHVVISVGDMVD